MVPFHFGVPRNEKADKIAKEEGECKQPDNEISYFEKKKIIQVVA